MIALVVLWSCSVCDKRMIDLLTGCQLFERCWKFQLEIVDLRSVCRQNSMGIFTARFFITFPKMRSYFTDYLSENNCGLWWNTSVNENVSLLAGSGATQPLAVKLEFSKWTTNNRFWSLKNIFQLLSLSLDYNQPASINCCKTSKNELQSLFGLVVL